MRSLCRCLHHAEVCTHIYMMTLGLAGNLYSIMGGGGDVPGDNLWSDSVTGDSGSLWGGGGVAYYRGLSCENCKLCEWGYILVGATLPYGRE